MLVPLYGFLEGDTIGLVVLIHDHETVGEAGKRLQQAASVRVAPTARAGVFHNGKRLDADWTIGRAGLTALERIDVVPEVD
jgi:hypothetical protein